MTHTSIDSEETAHLKQFIKKMTEEGLPSPVVTTFAHYYNQIVAGETGRIYNKDIRPVDPGEIEDFHGLGQYARLGRQVLSKAARIVLNGGLGTTMGLNGPKSLITVKNGLCFLDIILNQTLAQQNRLVLMNSFSTDTPTRQYLERCSPPVMPLMFLQHRFPKVLQKDLMPACCPENPSLEWNPPGHGDIYLALHTSGMLDTLLDEGIEYALICNCDNLGAVMDESLLGFFVHHNISFMMEVAERTPADVKGGHLARHRNGRLLLREAAQCPEAELDAFRDIRQYRYFNTNTLWVNLNYLKDLIDADSPIYLPLILNPKPLDPTNPDSPKVYQVETAMGAAISKFDGATAVRVPRTRFFPVKKTNELLILRSDYFQLIDNNRLELNPERVSDNIRVRLDPTYFAMMDDFNHRFPDGVPSLVSCESFEVEGDVKFEGDITIRGKVRIINKSQSQQIISKGQQVTQDIVFSS